MPLTEKVTFKTLLQKGNRLQVPEFDSLTIQNFAYYENLSFIVNLSSLVRKETLT